MVDSIRQPVRIGIVKPTGPLRPLEQRRQSQQDAGNPGDDDPQRSGEEDQGAPLDRDPGGAGEACTPPSSEEENLAVKPGRCIDIRI